MPRRHRLEVTVALKEAVPLSEETVCGIVREVLLGEGARSASLNVTFYSSQRMRALNRRAFGKDCSTDVIAFPMRHDDRLIGDVYVCPARALESARVHSVNFREELIRLVVHGTLHVLGYDHNTGVSRVKSPMWMLQEQYLRQLVPRDTA